MDSTHSQMPSTASEAPELHSADFEATHHKGRKALRGEQATPDDSYSVRHDEYFFEDGNVTFLVGGTLYCIHRYFFSRNSVYFSTRFAKLGVRDHRALPIIISIDDIERKDFEALLSVLYPTNFEAHELSYEQWKSVLHLSTRWGLASLRKLALKSITLPTPHDQLVLARTYSVDEWVLPALTALCERTFPLSLDEAREMRMEDVILVATVREEIRGGALQVDAADVPRYIEGAQAGKMKRPVDPDVYCDRQKSKIASGVDRNFEAEIAKMKGPSGTQQRASKESNVEHPSKEAPAESPGAEQPHVVEGTPRDSPEKTVIVSVRKTEEAPPEPVAWPLNEEGLTENHAAEDMDTEGKMSAEIIRLLDAEDRAHAEKTSKEQETAAHAKEKADSEARARDDAKEKARKKLEEATLARANAVAAMKAAKKEKKASKKAA